MVNVTQPFIPPFGEVVTLDDYAPNFSGGRTQTDIRYETRQLRQQLYTLQAKLYTQAQYALLIILQGMDASGKDSSINHLYRHGNPSKIRLANFTFPTEEEQRYDFLWRIHKAVPPKGYVGIFNRSHYEDVVGARVRGMIMDYELQQRYDHINNFERMLIDNGTVILKFYLHVSKEEQGNRLQGRAMNNRWKLTEADWESHVAWEEYTQAYTDMFTHCNTPEAPWYIVPAHYRWYRNWVLTKTIVQTLEDMPLDPVLDEIDV